MEYEESSDKSRCDKGIARIKSCRECIFQVLCKFNSFYKKDGEKKDTMWDLHKSDGIPKTS